jgi:radical SAM superfamily enzyme YgiQ (UPF0313 family)
MKILFINPKFPRSLWSFEGITDIIGARSGQTPLGLITVAAMTPPEISIEVADENCAPLDLDTDADVVAIGCWNVQYRRAQELAKEFRRRGKLVVVGGPYPTLCPERFTDGQYDVVFEGETELTWPAFCADLLKGATSPWYKQTGNVDIRESPIPRFDLLNAHDYVYYFVQTTRGCPFQCDFCDIIITDGRIPRTKNIERVIAEIEKIASNGAKYVSFSDANFMGNPQYAEDLCRALGKFGRAHGFPLTFSAEATLNLADRPQLLELMREANFTGVFLGIESPRVNSLLESKKRQNVRHPLLESIRKIQSHNLVITGGMIVGFDNDDPIIFQEQFDFLMQAGIPFTTCGLLAALEKTPLYERLKNEGRLLAYDSADRLGHGSDDINFIPKRITVDEVKIGYNWLIRALYKRENYRSRLITALSQFQRQWENRRNARGEFDQRGFTILRNVLRYFVFTRDAGLRRFFLGTVLQALRKRFSLETLVTVLSYLIAHKHFHSYIAEAHGDPESVGMVSPFSKDLVSEPWWQDKQGSEFVRRLKHHSSFGMKWPAWVHRHQRRAVAVPEAVLSDRFGLCLSRYLNELGVEVVPLASAALSHLKDRVDILVVPIISSMRRGKEELHQISHQLQDRLVSEIGKLPEIIRISIDGDRIAVLDAFAKIGLHFSRNNDLLKRAFVLAMGAPAIPGESAN